VFLSQLLSKRSYLTVFTSNV